MKERSLDILLKKEIILKNYIFYILWGESFDIEFG